MAETTGIVRDRDARRARATKILDAAAELLLRHGYRRTTIDDVARAAGVGKGTIYLHWRTREELFETVVQREVLAATEEMVVALRADPTLVLLHRMTRHYFGTMLRRPLLRALFVGDLELLGKLAEAGDRELEVRQDQALKKCLRLLVEHGLVRTAFGMDDLFYVYQSICLGFFLSESMVTEPNRISQDRMVDLLAATVRQTFEPSKAPPASAIRAAAPRVIEAFQEIVDVTRAHVDQ